MTEKIEIVDCNVMGLSKRLDAVEDRFYREIAEVRNDLADHRNNTELHHAQPGPEKQDKCVNEVVFLHK